MHGHGERVLRVTDIPNGTKPTVLTVHVPRYRCTACGYIHQPKVSGINEAHHMTERAVLAVAKRGLETTFRSISEDFGISHETAKRILTKYLDEHADQLAFATPTFMGFDEIKIRGLGRVAVITDIEHRTLFDLLHEPDQHQLTEYFGKLKGREKVLCLFSDTYRPFEKSISEFLPNAKWVIDKRHVVIKASEAVEYVQRGVLQSLPDKVLVKTKHGLAHTLRKNQRDLTPEEKSQISVLRKSQTAPANEINEKLSLLVAAFELKETFSNIFAEQSKATAKSAFVAWEASIPQGDIFVKFRDLAKTVHDCETQIFTRWDCPVELINGYTECADRLLREYNMKGRGYSFKILRARMLFRSENLEEIEMNRRLTYGPLLSGKNTPFGKGLLSIVENSATEGTDDWIINENRIGGDENGAL